LDNYLDNSFLYLAKSNKNRDFNQIFQNKFSYVGVDFDLGKGQKLKVKNS